MGNSEYGACFDIDDAYILAFLWTPDGGMSRINSLVTANAVSADGNVVGGMSWDGTRYAPSIWSQSHGHRNLGHLPGATGGFYDAAVLALSQDGSVAAGIDATVDGDQAFRWTEAIGIQPLGDMPGETTNSIVRDVSADGTVIVGVANYQSNRLDGDAFIWDEANGMRTVQSVLANDYGLHNSLVGWRLRTAYISGDGTALAGTGTNPEGNLEAWLAVLDADATPLEGDTDRDFDVDLDDLNNVRNDFGCALPVVCIGDTAPFDSDVDLDDLNAVRNNFGATTVAASVPEPGSWALFSLAGFGHLVWRCRR